ncbi:hypothetical protein GPECTOR_60g724 [Gonium pectorale]|uniref:LMBR1 protein n=1 Tax=Gonium pectorale TaxID=33097 RepID=A0A150G517_GONPE|nr:hypothetical protein GPECTOR_60g724 [Gonium pectorale]|eukprot:KXZ44947.1 hypothetical protein GPECTOR_60g724 [Gonium pectorale]
MWTFFIFSMVLVSGAILLLLRRYCAHSVVLSVKVTTAYAWLTAMAVVAIVPLDVFSTLDKRQPEELGYMWDVAFWSTQVLTWLLLPFFQYYSDAGDFTVKGKCLTSLKENAILYGSVAAVGLVGLIASILLLGYGLVEIPRNMWKADPERQLKWAGKYAEKVMKSTAELETVVTIIAANERQMRRHDPLRKYMDIIVEHVEKESPIKPSDLTARAAANGGRGIDIESMNAEDLEYNYDVAGLAALRRRMFFAISSYNGDRAMYEEVMLEAFELEDVVKCRQLNDFTPRLPTRSPIKKAVWYYKCALRAHWHRVLAIAFACLSVLIVWAEATIVSPVDISPLSLLIKGSQASEFGVQIITLLPLAYICACTYAALFSITAFDYNKLIPRATIGSALMQNGTLMCRFAAPTCWNFYHMVRMTGIMQIDGGSRTVFEAKMGSMDVPAFLRQHLNTYLPLILVVECIITAFNLWDRIMGICVSSKYKFSNDDDVDDAYTEKGRMLVAREREAVAKGFALGQVLTTAFFDLDFPDIGGPRSRLQQQKKGFLGLFGKKAPPPPPALAAPQRPAMTAAGGPAAGGPADPPKFKSATAAAAAARWLGRGNGLPDGGGLGGAAPSSSSVLDTTSAKASLLASRQYDKSPTPEYDTPHAAAGGGGKSGLDGIFADIGAGSGAGAGPGGMGRGGAASSLAGGAGRPDGAGPAAHSEKDSLLGNFWRS